MGIIKREDIIAYRINDEVICENCLTEADDQNMTNSEKDYVLESQIDPEEEYIFCDRCKKRLN